MSTSDLWAIAATNAASSSGTVMVVSKCCKGPQTVRLCSEREPPGSPDTARGATPTEPCGSCRLPRHPLSHEHPHRPCNRRIVGFPGVGTRFFGTLLSRAGRLATVGASHRHGANRVEEGIVSHGVHRISPRADAGGPKVAHRLVGGRPNP